MAIQHLDYFYEAQQRRFLEQIVRAFSGFQYKTGWRSGVEPQLKMVPCRLANRDRMVGHIVRNNSENTLLTVPLITVDQTGLAFRRDALQSRVHVDTRTILERAVDDEGNYTGEAGNRYQVERVMALPFEMAIQVDIWTSNMEQKHQLMEQILTVVSPDFEIQNSDSAIDWTAKTTISLEDVTWTSRSIPIGTENEIETATLTFKLPMWLSPPAKVTTQKIIQTIVANIHDGELVDGVIEGDRIARTIVTPDMACIRIANGVITLLGPEGNEDDPAGNPYEWQTLLDQYGLFRPAQSQLRLKVAGIDSSSEIVGTLQLDNSNASRLLWTVDVDTLPANNLNPVNAVIDPLRSYPGHGLPAAATGQRYLLLNDVGGPTQAWGNLVARENDIIHYQSGAWSVSFSSGSVTATKHVLNTASSTQLKWTGEMWVLAIDGEYGPGYWRLVM